MALHGWCWRLQKGCRPLQLVQRTDGHMQGLGRHTASTPVPGEQEQSCSAGS